MAKQRAEELVNPKKPYALRRPKNALILIRLTWYIASDWDRADNAVYENVMSNDTFSRVEPVDPVLYQTMIHHTQRNQKEIPPCNFHRMNRHWTSRP